MCFSGWGAQAARLKRRVHSSHANILVVIADLKRLFINQFQQAGGVVAGNQGQMFVAGYVFE